MPDETQIYNCGGINVAETLPKGEHKFGFYKENTLKERLDLINQYGKEPLPYGVYCLTEFVDKLEHTKRENKR
jgi:hypothetical protein